MRSAVVLEFGEQGEFIVRPDAVAQIVEQLDDRHGLIGRPEGIDEQIEPMVEAGRLMMSIHGVCFALRFLDLAAARS